MPDWRRIRDHQLLQPGGGAVNGDADRGGAISFPVALCLVIGANLGSGLLAMLNNSAANAARRVALGSLLFKLVGSLIILPFVHPLAAAMHKLPLAESELVIYFHVFYNLLRCIAMVPFAGPMAKLCQRMIRDEPELDNHLKPSISTRRRWIRQRWRWPMPRETLRIGDAMEQMLGSLHKVMHGEPRQEKSCAYGGRYQRALHRH
jgi:phosphate:Na+ symporter